jgi:hypothetical protein
MARNIALVALGVVLGVIGGAALGIRADEDEVVAAAAEAGVDPTALLGAVNTTGLGARQYLTAVGELQTGAAPTPPPGAAPALIWDTLARCESTSRWSIANPPYYGGLQFDLPTWRAYGGLSFASRPDLAPRGAQIAVAERLHAARGFQPWPVCSRALGLR